MLDQLLLFYSFRTYEYYLLANKLTLFSFRKNSEEKAKIFIFSGTKLFEFKFYKQKFITSTSI